MYCFLSASLPELIPGAPPPLTVEEFDEMCRAELSAERFAALTAFDGTVTPDFRGRAELPGIYNTFGRFELYMRNRIARRRAEKAGEQLELPDPPEYFSDYDAAAGAIAAATDPAEREEMLDKLRRDFIDEQLLCKEFSFTALCAYRLKLLIANKYRYRKPEPGQQNFDAALERLSPNNPRKE